MALIKVIGALKLEPLEIKPEPTPVVEIYPDDIHSSDEDGDQENNAGETRTADVEDEGAIQLESLEIKREPAPVVEIHPDDIVHSSDEDEDNGKHISETRIAEDEVENEDGGGDNDIADGSGDNDISEDLTDNDFPVTENIRKDELLVINFNKQVLSEYDDNRSRESSNNENNWAKLYKTRESTNCLGDLKKMKKVYGPDWSKPIEPEEYTYISKTSMSCNYCHRKFTVRKNLARHIRVMHREKSITYHCPYCPKKSKWTLKKHILGNHKDEAEINWFQCYECDKKFRLKAYLVKHIHTQHRAKEKESSARGPACGQVFNSKRYTLVHAQKEHERRHQCDKRSFVGPHPNSPNVHIEDGRGDNNVADGRGDNNMADGRGDNNMADGRGDNNTADGRRDNNISEGRTDNDFPATENIRNNFNKQVVSESDNNRSRESSNNENNWANLYKTRESTNCLVDLKKMKKVYGSDWSKPIEPEEYTYVSKTSMSCNYCHRKFTERKNLARHIRVMHREKSITYHCPYCPKKSKWSLRTHILGNHKDEAAINWFQKNNNMTDGREDNNMADGRGDNNVTDVRGDNNTADGRRDNNISEGRTDNDFPATENIRNNFNKQVVSESDNNRSRESSNNENINWAKLYKTRESTNCLGDLKKMKKVYGPDWSKPIKPEEYTYISKTSMSCNYCHRESTDKKNLARHIRMMHRETSITYHCPYCPKKSKWSLRNHIVGNHKDEAEINWFQCYECDKKYRMKRYLIKHIHTQHRANTKESTASCPTCGRVFNSKRYMLVHAQKEHERKHQCDKCSFIGNHPSSLKAHIEVHHTDPNELPIYQCSKCDFKTRIRYAYSRHCKRHETKFVCDKCAFVTSTRVSLKLHLNLHEEKKTLRYLCSKCDYKTYRFYSLQVHERNHLKPEEINYFYCHHCSFKAKRKDNLKTHIKRHFKNEEVTFQCFICDFETKKRERVTKHLDEHHKSREIKEE